MTACITASHCVQNDNKKNEGIYEIIFFDFNYLGYFEEFQSKYGGFTILGISKGFTTASEEQIIKNIIVNVDVNLTPQAAENLIREVESINLIQRIGMYPDTVLFLTPEGMKIVNDISIVNMINTIHFVTADESLVLTGLTIKILFLISQNSLKNIPFNLFREEFFLQLFNDSYQNMMTHALREKMIVYGRDEEDLISYLSSCILSNTNNHPLLSGITEFSQMIKDKIEDICRQLIEINLLFFNPRDKIYYLIFKGKEFLKRIPAYLNQIISYNLQSLDFLKPISLVMPDGGNAGSPLQDVPMQTKRTFGEHYDYAPPYSDEIKENFPNNVIPPPITTSSVTNSPSPSHSPSSSPSSPYKKAKLSNSSVSVLRKLLGSENKPSFSAPIPIPVWPLSSSTEKQGKLVRRISFEKIDSIFEPLTTKASAVISTHIEEKKKQKEEDVESNNDITDNWEEALQLLDQYFTPRKQP